MRAVPTTVRGAVANRWQIARLVPRAGWGLVTATAGCNLVLGALPVLFIVGTSVMLGRVPAAVAGGPDSPQWSAVVVAFVLASAAFAGQQALAPVQTALGGRVVQAGDHATLTARGGLYAELYALQAQAYR